MKRRVHLVYVFVCRTT